MFGGKVLIGNYVDEKWCYDFGDWVDWICLIDIIFKEFDKV